MCIQNGKCSCHEAVCAFVYLEVEKKEGYNTGAQLFHIAEHVESESHDGAVRLYDCVVPLCKLPVIKSSTLLSSG